MVDIVINCLCSSGGDCEGLGLIVATNASLDAWRKEAHNFTKITCNDCGCTQDLADGTTHIAQIDKSMPRIDGLSPIQGVAGTTVQITGHRLDYGNLIVKFGSTTALIINRSENIAHVTVPIGTVGACDVSVENENGKRDTGGSIPNGFTYIS